MSTKDHPLKSEAANLGATVSNRVCGEDREVMERALRLIGDTWTLMIINNLMTGTRRFGELLTALGNVSPKTLSARLKMLEEVQIVQRHAYPEIPPRVEYQLTEKGEALLTVLESIYAFGKCYLADSPLRADTSCNVDRTCSS
jgi:DNA-binding HxlR family transcriptional regulator